MSISKKLPEERQYALPQTIDFIYSFGVEFYQQFNKPLQIDSAIRPASTQKKLRRTNRNAAPAEGETASSHEAGTTVDIAKRPLTKAQKHWLEMRLSYYVLINKAVVEEESNCFHIFVIPESL